MRRALYRKVNQAYSQRAFTLTWGIGTVYAF